MTQTSRPAAAPERQRDKERTRQEILDVAIREFARNGYSGARVDEIAARTRTTKRMIYYYFGGKEQLYIAALEQAYSTARDAERQLDVEHLDPVAAIRRLAELTFDHHESHPDFISLVAIENIHRAEFIAKSRALSELNTPAVSVLARILDRGRASGVFVRDVAAIDVHMLISAYCFFRMSNRHTFGAVFGLDMLDPARRDHYRTMVADMIVAYLTCPDRVTSGENHLLDTIIDLEVISCSLTVTVSAAAAEKGTRGPSSAAGGCSPAAAAAYSSWVTPARPALSAASRPGTACG